MSIWKVVKNFKNIVKGFWYRITNQNKRMSLERFKICNKCKEKDGEWCGICGCFLDAKTRVYNEHCPNDLW